MHHVIVMRSLSVARMHIRSERLSGSLWELDGGGECTFLESAIDFFFNFSQWLCLRMARKPDFDDALGNLKLTDCDSFLD